MTVKRMSAVIGLSQLLLIISTIKTSYLNGAIPMLLKRYQALSFVVASALATASYAQTSAGQLDTLAQRLIEARAEVEEMQSDLDIKREEHKGKMAYLSAQITEFEANQEREELRIAQLEQGLDKLRVEAQSAGADANSLQPVVLRIIAQLRSVIEQSIPFKQQERLAGLDEIVSQLEAGVSPPQRAINRIWAFVEDELRISRENAIYSQTIELNGQSVLADVAKLGSVALYFRTRDNRYGIANPGSDNWAWQLVDDTLEQELIENLFDALRKQIRQGFFELPNALPALTTTQS